MLPNCFPAVRTAKATLVIIGAMLAVACGGSSNPTRELRAQEITYGKPDNRGHPYTASVVRKTSATAPWKSRCTGTLVARNVVITAAHCYGNYLGLPHGQVGVTFDPVVGMNPKVIIGQYIPNPDFALDFSTLPMHDNAVVVLDNEVEDVPMAALPPRGLLDAMAAAGLLDGRKFNSVGYGIIEPADPTNPVFDPSTLGTRRVATGTYLSLSPTNLLLSQNPASGDGGTCIFDSGGPILFSDTNVLSSQTQGGDDWCLLTNDTFRLDTADAQGFLSHYVKIPSTVAVCHHGADTENVTVKGLVVHLRHGDRIGACSDDADNH